MNQKKTIRAIPRQENRIKERFFAIVLTKILNLFQFIQK